MATEPMECQVLVLRVSIHCDCEGCKKKVKKVLLHVDGVYRCDIDARSNKVTVTASRRVDANILVAKLRKSGKQAEPWPEEPKQQQQQQPAESQSQETKNQNDEARKPDEPAEKSGPDSAEASAAEPSNPQPSPEPKKSADETPKPAQDSKDASNAKANADANANGNTSDETRAATGQQPNEAKGKAEQHQEERPIDARVTMEYDRGSYVNRMPTPQPVHAISYNVVRPTTSAAHYAAAPTPTPMPMPTARPGPSQGYIDEYAPSYYSRSSSPYEPYYYPQPSPYRYQHPATDDYYYGAPQRSAFSPPRDAYGDMFNDENANSCSVM